MSSKKSSSTKSSGRKSGAKNSAGRRSYPGTRFCDKDISQDRKGRYVVHTSKTGKLTVVKADQKIGCDVSIPPVYNKREAKKVAGIGVKRFPSSAYCKGEVPKERKGKYVINMEHFAKTGRITIPKADGKNGCELAGPFYSKNDAKREVKRLLKDPAMIAKLSGRKGSVKPSYTFESSDNEEELEGEGLGVEEELGDDINIEVEGDSDEEMFPPSRFRPSRRVAIVEDDAEPITRSNRLLEYRSNPDVEEVTLDEFEEEEIPENSVFDVLNNNKDISIFMAFLKSAQAIDKDFSLENLKSSEQNLYVFAPKNDSLIKLLKSGTTIEEIIASGLLQRHVVADEQLIRSNDPECYDLQLDKRIKWCNKQGRQTYGGQSILETLTATNGEVLIIEAPVM